jgi:hypothetical protein
MTDEQFIEEWQKHGSATGVAEATGAHVRNVLDRRKRMANRGIHLTTVPRAGYETRTPTTWRSEECWTWPRELQVQIPNGTVVVSSDHHYWPGPPTLAHTALLAVIKLVKPRAKVLNGDIFDGISVSRHPPFGWSHKPTVIDELHACQERVGEIEQALPRGCERLWNIGNHCLRFERTLAVQAKEFANMSGMRLADHFPGWELQWSTLFNPDAHTPTMIKHRHANGVHAAYNNAMKGGLNIVTGHTHSLEVKPWGDWRGRRWGVQTGTIHDLNAPAFEYQENAPSPACSGFAVLTFKDGELMPPELCEAIRGKAYFRGQVVAEEAA